MEQAVGPAPFSPHSSTDPRMSPGCPVTNSRKPAVETETCLSLESDRDSFIDTGYICLSMYLLMIQ